MTRIPAVVAACLVPFLLSACDTVEILSRAAGVETEEQEEALATNTRLSLPPDFNLRPPQGGSGKSRATAATIRGRQAILGDEPAQTTISAPTYSQGARTPGEEALLKRAASSQPVDRDIRRVVDRETIGSEEGEKVFTEKLLKWRERPEGDDGEQEDGTRAVEPDNVPVIKKKGDIF